MVMLPPFQVHAIAGRGLLVPNAASPAIRAQFPLRRMDHADVWREYAFELLPLLSLASFAAGH
jgi:hypothetical protein